MTDFWRIPGRNVELTYENLVEKVQRTECFSPIVYEEDTEDIVTALVLSLVHDHPITLLDTSMSDEAISQIGVSENQLCKTISVSPPTIKSVDGLIEAAAETSDWELEVYTSGTTGTPKPVAQDFETVTRNVKQGDRFSEDNWAFAYNPTHYGGIQVFFQAFLNTNQMTYLFECSPQEVVRSLEEHSVTHISATPTFYRHKVLHTDHQFPEVRRVTFGGEAFDQSIIDDLGRTFPNAEVRNVYASTEAGSLFESDGELFSIPEKLSKFVEVSDSGELVLHDSLLGGVNNDYEGEWYHTGDLVEFVDEDQFRFVGRKSDFVNVGGYRVNPNDIEEQIMKNGKVIDAAVSARENSVTGRILTAKIVIHDHEATDAVCEEIRDQLSQKLDPAEVPRIIDVVESINRTRSGKKKR